MKKILFALCAITGLAQITFAQAPQSLNGTKWYATETTEKDEAVVTLEAVVKYCFTFNEQNGTMNMLIKMNLIALGTYAPEQDEILEPTSENVSFTYTYSNGKGTIVQNKDGKDVSNDFVVDGSKMIVYKDTGKKKEVWLTLGLNSAIDNKRSDNINIIFDE